MTSLASLLALTLMAVPAADDVEASSSGSSASPPAASSPSSRSRPVLLDFHASWCGPCQQMRPAVQKLVERGYPVKSIDIDASRELAQRYNVTAVPTFIIIDARGEVLERTSGVHPAADLAQLYHDAYGRARAAAGSGAALVATAPTRTIADDEAESTDGSVIDPGASSASASSSIPKPWESSVRIKILNPGSYNFGSGTVIWSDARESIILTCAHIFTVEGARTQPKPAQFNRKVLVDLFDGQLHGKDPQMMHPLETDIQAQVIDYDHTMDVGLIRIRPGRPLPVSPVVGVDWSPRVGEKMDTVGCSEGRNATPWTTHITNASFKGQVAGRWYEAIECDHAPRQGRSGGGLFTRDGYLAGVCDFAEPQGQHGLYASPRSIHKFLDRNRLTVCYNPSVKPPDTLMASASATAPRRSGSATASAPRTKYRSQDSSLAAPDRIPMPEPEMLGVRLDPIARAGASAPLPPGWQPLQQGPAQIARSEDRSEQAVPVEIGLSPGAVAPSSPATPIGEAEADQIAAPSRPSNVSSGGGGWKAARSPVR
jgi:thiol-disulfide isomerase/thioredoxin